MLTDTKLGALKPRANAYRIADTNSLCVEVPPTGAKVWRYRYRYAGQASMITLDEYPAMSLMLARAEREWLRSLLRVGANPAQVARVERAAQTACYCLREQLLMNPIAHESDYGSRPGLVQLPVR